MIYGKHKGDRPAILITSDREHKDKWLEERGGGGGGGALCLVRDKKIYISVCLSINVFLSAFGVLSFSHKDSHR